MIKPMLAVATIMLSSCAAAETGPADPKLGAAERAQLQRGIEENGRYQAELFAKRGVPPAEELARQGRNVRRMLAMVWLPGELPLIEIERHRDGRTTLTLVGASGAGEPRSLPAGSWERLVQDEDVVFRTELKRPTPMPEGIVSCHGDTAYFEAVRDGRVERAGANQCINALERFTPAKSRYMERFVELALSTEPACKPEKSPRDSLYRCFAAPGAPGRAG